MLDNEYHYRFWAGLSPFLTNLLLWICGFRRIDNCIAVLLQWDVGIPAHCPEWVIDASAETWIIDIKDVRSPIKVCAFISFCKQINLVDRRSTKTSLPVQTTHRMAMKMHSPYIILEAEAIGRNTEYREAICRRVQDIPSVYAWRWCGSKSINRFQFVICRQ